MTKVKTVLGGIWEGLMKEKENGKPIFLLSLPIGLLIYCFGGIPEMIIWIMLRRTWCKKHYKSFFKLKDL